MNDFFERLVDELYYEVSHWLNNEPIRNLVPGYKGKEKLSMSVFCDYAVKGEQLIIESANTLNVDLECDDVLIDDRVIGILNAKTYLSIYDNQSFIRIEINL